MTNTSTATAIKNLEMELFPVPSTKTNPFPNNIWPDLKGIQTAELLEVKNDLANWKKFWKNCTKWLMVSVDTETSGLRPFNGSRIVGVAAAYYDGESIHGGYWNFRHAGHPAHPWCKTHGYEIIKDMTKAEQAKFLKTMGKCEKCKLGRCPGYKEPAIALPISAMQDMIPIFESIIIAGQNFKYDCRMFSVDNVPVPATIIDTMLVAHLWDENKRFYNLDTLASEMGDKKLGDTIKEYADEHHIDITKTGHAQIPYAVEKPYAIRDTVLVLKRLQFERERWVKTGDPRLIECFQVENGSIPSFAAMEINGMKMDRKYIESSIARLEKELLEIQKDVYKEAKEEFDILSTQQLWGVLEKKGFKPISLTPGGAPSLDDASLAAYNDPFCDLIKGYRGRHKMLNTYFKPFIETHVDAQDYMHADFIIQGTVSGRVSCREPNLQNIPRFEKFGSRTKMGTVAKALQAGLKTEEDKSADTLETRRCFIPRSKDHSLFFFDYAQMELRIFADYAEEEFLIKTLAAGGDIHEATAREIFPNFPDKDTDKKLYEYFRQLTKQINFGIIYGMGKNKLAVQLNVPVDDSVKALEMLQKVFMLNPKLAADCTTYSREEIQDKLEEHRVMTASRLWDGLRQLCKEISMKINVDPLEEYLLKGSKEMHDNNLRFLYSADTFLKKYHGKFPNIKKFTKNIERVIGERGYIFNRFGRRYHMTVDKAYVGVNREVQGSCGDMVKVAQHRVHKLLLGKKSVMIDNVHDELQFDIHHKELSLIPKIKDAMEYFPTIGVKMQVDIDYSHTDWAHKREWSDENEFVQALKEKKNG